MGTQPPGSDPLAQEAVARGLIGPETLAEFARHAAARGRSVVDLLVAAGRLQAADLEALSRPRPRSAPSTELAAASTLVQGPPAPTDRESEREDLIGRVLGGARIEARIGRGGMGVVYRAHHLTLDKAVAIKVLSRRFVSDNSQVMRFIQEARAAARVEHQHLIQVHDVDCEDDIYYIVMQYVEGRDLAERIAAEGPLPIEDGVRIFLEVLEGVDEAHKSGIIHRDLKPGNILLDRYGRVKVTDFGLAQDRLLGEWSSGQGEVQGTPQYMSPEQCRGEPVDVRSDVYSLGMTFYHALTGVLPFDGDDPWEVVRAQIERFPPLPGTLRPDLPRGLGQILERMIAKRPENRYPSVQAVRRDLEPIARRFQAVSPTPVVERGRGAGHRRRPVAAGSPWMAMGLVATSALALAGIAVGISVSGGPADESTADPVPAEAPAPLSRAQAEALLARIDQEWLPAAEAGRLEDSIPRVLEGAGRVLASPHEDLHLAALVARIRAHSIAGRSDLALADAHALGRFEPGLMQSMLQRARSAALADLERRFQAGHFVSAHEFAESAAKSDPETWHFHYARGRAALLCAESGRAKPTYEEALDALDEAVRRAVASPLLFAVLHVRARALHRLGRFDEALRDVEASIAANDRGDFLLESIEVLGLALAQLGRVEEAFAYLSIVRHAGRAVLDPQWEVYAGVQRSLGESGPASHERIERAIRLGACVTELVPRAARPIGLEAGDVVLEVRDVRIYSPERLRAELLDRSRLDHAGPIRARVVRDGAAIEVEIFPAAIEDLQARSRVDRGR